MTTNNTDTELLSDDQRRELQKVLEAVSLAAEYHTKVHFMVMLAIVLTGVIS